MRAIEAEIAEEVPSLLARGYLAWARSRTTTARGAAVGR